MLGEACAIESFCRMIRYDSLSQGECERVEIV
jgi:hypothetical protein